MRNLVVLASLVLASICATAQITPAMVNRQDSPLWITSINSTLDDMLHAVTTKNMSSRRIRSFRLGLIMSVPSACAERKFIGPEMLLDFDRVDLVPGSSVVTSNYRLEPTTINKFATDHFAKSVHTQIAVVYVQFDDGTSWSIPPHGLIYDQALMEKDGTLQCSLSTDAVLTRASVSAKCNASYKTISMSPAPFSFTYQCVQASTKSVQ